MIGLFIGSFNPPTKAHLEICLNLKKHFEKIIFVPVNTKEKHLVSFMDRVKMLNIYKHDYHFLDIDNIMEKYSYFDFRILDILKKKYHDVAIIMGSDLLLHFDKFNNYQKLLDNYMFYLLPRDSINVEELIKEKYSKYQKKFYICDYSSSISSSKCRELLKQGMIPSDFLDKKIIDYIREKHLYF